MRRLLTLIVLAILAMPVFGNAQTQNDREGVRQAVLDYVDAIYNVEPERIERSIHPELAKRGFYKRDDASEYSEGKMTFERLIEVAKNWNKNHKDMSKAKKEIIIYEVLDQTASVKLIADWGIDYMHLAKYKGKWMIVNVMWQSHPKASN
jgi:hypothetical protein